MTWLKPRLAPVRIATKVPSPRPNELVKVSLTGGSEPNRVSEWSQLTFECWALDTDRASDICREIVKPWIKALTGESVNGVFVRSVRTVGGPVYFEDPETKLPRYQYTAELQHRYVSVGDN